MKLKSVGTVIVTRELALSGKYTVKVTLGKPERYPDGNGDCYCPYQITGMGSEDIRYSSGVDGIQALLLALERIGGELYTSDEYKTGTLSRFPGDRDLGFPLPDSIKHILPDTNPADEFISCLKAAKQGNVHACVGLGDLYFRGHGVAQDYVEAGKWFHRAAEKGNAQAYLNLGQMYESGQGVQQDNIQAFKWYSLSATKHFPHADKARDQLATIMTPKQIAEAKRLAATWKKR